MEEIFREYQETKSQELRDKLVEANLHLAEILARKYIGRGIDYDDLYQIASYGLVLAVDRFDPEKGVKFVTYATPTIIGEIKKYFRDTMWSLKVPRRMKEISIKILGAKERLQEALGRVPTVADLAEHLELSEEDILEALESGRAFSTFSLDQESDQFDDNDAYSYEKYLGDEEEGYSIFENSEVLERVINKLTPTEKEIMRKRFLHEISQKEVAEALGISQMTVSRIEKAMKEKFRNEYNR